MRVEWSISARAEFRDLVLYIGSDNPLAAIRVAERLEAAIEGLTRFNSGRPGRIAGTYEKVVRGAPFIIAFKIEGDPADPVLFIAHIVHTSRNWPPDDAPQD